MRKFSVKCAAANDDEEDFAFVDKEPKRARTSRAVDNHRAAAEQSLPKKARKEKEFAWMESSDEDDAEQSGEKGTDEDEATLENLDAVQSFGRMMLLADSLHQKLKSGKFEAEEVAAACRALARSRFFDGDLLEVLSTILPRMILGEKLMAEQVTNVITCLKELNYYKKDIFSAIAKSFKPKVTTLSAIERSTWLEAMRTLGHKQELDFMQMLEVPPLHPSSPYFRTVKCVFFARGNCESGASCTYAHNHRAPLSLDDDGKEDAWRRRSVIMTHDQKYVFKERNDWGQTVGPNMGQASAASSSMSQFTMARAWPSGM